MGVIHIVEKVAAQKVPTGLQNPRLLPSMPAEETRPPLCLYAHRVERLCFADSSD